MVVPWDLESLYEWFPEEDLDLIRDTCELGGASPGSHIDVYSPKDELGILLTALRSRGYNVVQRPFLQDLYRALDALVGRAPWPGLTSLDVNEPETWFEVWGTEDQRCYDSWNGDWSITVVYGRPRPGEVALLVRMPEYEDGYTPLPPTTEPSEAQKEARGWVDFWLGEVTTNNPDVQTS